MLQATLDSVEQLTPRIRQFWFRPQQPLDFVAGQFTELYLPHAEPDDRGQKRWFTISSAPGGALFSITSKLAAEQPSSFKRALCALEPGAKIQFTDPMGDFVLPKDARLPLIFIAGGIGITPMHSMIKYLADRHQQRDIQLIYDVHSPEELLFTDLFDSYGLQFTPVVTTADASWSGDIGKINITRLQRMADEAPTALIYMSGPEQLVELLTAELQKSGVASHRLIADFFHGYRSV